MDVLTSLLQHAGSVVSLEELLASVWAGRVVEHGAVHQHVSRIRRALGDDAREPRYIENVPRRGYRAIAPVTSAGSVHVDAAASGRDAVVLPIRDLSADGNFGWFAARMTEQLRTEISLWHQVNVLPRAFTPSELQADGSGVDVVIDGYVQTISKGAEITLQAIDARNRRTLWTESFSIDDDDASPIEQRIASSIARFFGQSVVGTIPGPSRPAAARSYLEFLHQKTYGDVDGELRCLDQALRLDPDWSAGWAARAVAEARALSVTLEDRWREAARRSLARAKAVSKRPGIDWSSSAALLDVSMEGRLDAAERRARVAIEKAGYVHTYGFVLLCSGLPHQAAQMLDLATVMLPHDPTGWEYLAIAHAHLGDAQRALVAARRLMDLWPEDPMVAPYTQLWALPHAGEFDAAEALLGRLERAIQRAPARGVGRGLVQGFWLQLAFELAMCRGGSAEARALLADPDAHAPSLAGILLLRLGDVRADDYLARAAARPHCERFQWFHRSVHLPSEQSDHPQLVALRDALGFSAAWRHELMQRAQQLPAWCRVDGDPVDITTRS